MIGINKKTIFINDIQCLMFKTLWVSCTACPFAPFADSYYGAADTTLGFCILIILALAVCIVFIVKQNRCVFEKKRFTVFYEYGDRYFVSTYQFSKVCLTDKKEIVLLNDNAETVFSFSIEKYSKKSVDSLLQEFENRGKIVEQQSIAQSQSNIMNITSSRTRTIKNNQINGSTLSESTTKEILPKKELEQHNNTIKRKLEL